MTLRDVLHQLMGRRYMAPEGGDGAAAGAGGGGGGGAGGDGSGGDGKGAAGAGASGAGSSGAGAGDGKGGDPSKGGAAGGDGKGGKSLMEELGKGGAAGASAGADGKGGAAGDGSGKTLTDEEKAIQAAEKDTRRPTHVPAKYWDAAKGEIRAEAAFKSLGELEGRMKAHGLPPKEAGEYKVEIPEVLKKSGFDLEPAQAKGFRELAHGLGLTQKQFDGVMSAYFGQITTLSDQVAGFSAGKARENLLAYYKTEEAMKANVSAAYKTFIAYADEADQAMIDQIGNIPAVIRILAKVHKDMGEDPGVAPDAILDGESLETLMRGAPGKDDSPYWNESDPRHKATKAKVMRHHEATAAANRRKAA